MDSTVSGLGVAVLSAPPRLVFPSTTRRACAVCGLDGAAMWASPVDKDTGEPPSLVMYRSMTYFCSLCYFNRGEGFSSTVGGPEAVLSMFNGMVSGVVIEGGKIASIEDADRLLSAWALLERTVWAEAKKKMQEPPS